MPGPRRAALRERPERTLVVGRSPFADVVIADPSVAPHHAEIVVTSRGRLHLTDCATPSGTWRLGPAEHGEGSSEWRPVRQAFVREDEPLRLGEYRCLAGQLVRSLRPRRRGARLGDRSCRAGLARRQPAGARRTRRARRGDRRDRAAEALSGGATVAGERGGRGGAAAAGPAHLQPSGHPDRLRDRGPARDRADRPASAPCRGGDPARPRPLDLSGHRPEHHVAGVRARHRRVDRARARCRSRTCGAACRLSPRGRDDDPPGARAAPDLRPGARRDAAGGGLGGPLPAAADPARRDPVPDQPVGGPGQRAAHLEPGARRCTRSTCATAWSATSCGRSPRSASSAPWSGSRWRSPSPARSICRTRTCSPSSPSGSRSRSTRRCSRW